MTDGRDPLAVVADHVALALEPLRRAMRDLPSFQAFMRRLGWDVSSLPPAYARVGTAVDELMDRQRQLVANPDPAVVLRALEQIAAVYDALQHLDGVPDGVVDPGSFLAEVGPRLAELLIVDYLRVATPRLAAVLEILGGIGDEQLPAGPGRVAAIRPRVRVDELARSLAGPGPFLRRLYGWGSSDINFPLVSDHLVALGGALGLDVALEAPAARQTAGYQGPPADRTRGIASGLALTLLRTADDTTPLELGLLLLELPAEGARMAGLVLQPKVPSAMGVEIGLGEHSRLRVRAGTDLASTFGVVVRPAEVTVRYPFAPGTTVPAAGAGIAFEFRPPRPRAVFGAERRTRLELRGATASLRLDVRGAEVEVAAVVALEGLALVIVPADVNAFLSQVLGGEQRIAWPLEVGVSSRAGFTFGGSPRLVATIATHMRFGAVRVDQVELGVRTAAVAGRSPEVALDVALAFRGELGPIAFSAQGLGLRLLITNRPGNAGPVDLQAGLRVPTGLGLAIRAGPIQGGGAIVYDETNGRYFGSFQLRFGAIAITALGLLDTRLPGGREGFSLLVILTARFPGIELGFGIQLTGVGGLIGVHRRTDIDALRERFATGTAGRILDPENPVRDAAVLVSELAAVFPAAEGAFVVGPSLQLTWGVLRLDVGIFIELPGPARIILLGKARATIDNPSGGRPVLQLRIDFIGVLDFVRRLLEFDAVLVDSHLLEVFELTGGAGFRLSWGDQPYAALSVGGFHPDFNPAPMVFPPTLQRVAMTRGSPQDALYLRFEGYYAVTTNSYQLGASVEAIVRAMGFVARGFLSFDVLIRIQPFSFCFAFRAAFSIAFGDITLAAVRIAGSLSGPGPVTFTGELSFEVLLVRVSWRDTFRLGTDAQSPLRPVPSALEALAGELDVANLSAIGGGDPLVNVDTSRVAADRPVVLPTGGVAWRQTRAPLALLLQRLDGVPLARPETVTLTADHPLTPELDWFAPGSFADLTDAEALNRRSFERLQAGANVAFGGPVASDAVVHPVTIEEYRLPTGAAGAPAAIALPPWLVLAAEARLGRDGTSPPPPLVTVTEPAWQACAGDGTLLADGVSEAQAHQLVRSGAPGGAAVSAGETVAPWTF